MLVTVNELMTIERFLLEIDARLKFTLSFSDACKLYNYLKDVGRITNIYFELLEEFYRKYPDKDKISEYKNKISGDKLEFNIEEIQKFIDNVFNTAEDDEFKNIVLKNRYWKN